MSTSRFDMALRLGPVPKRSSQQELVDRIRMVLETEMGQLPWMPDYGTRIADFPNRTGDTSRLSDAEGRLSGAISEWVPGVTVSSINATLKNHVAAAGMDRQLPLAERAISSRSVSAVLYVEVVVDTPEGPLSLEATLEP